MSWRIWMQFGITAFAFSLSGCGDGLQGPIDPELRPYIDSFYVEAARRGIELSGPKPTAELVDLTWPTIYEDQLTLNPSGLCVGIGIINKIQIRRDTWYTRSHRQKTALMYHELGHCVLDREHNHSQVEVWNNPENPLVLPSREMVGESLMSVGGHREAVLDLLWDKFVDELFSKTNPIAAVAKVSNTRAREHRNRWLEVVTPITQRFVTEGARFGVILPEVTILIDGDFTQGLPLGTFSAHELSMDLNGIKEPKEDDLEFVIFGFLASRLLPIENGKITIEIKDGLYYPSSIRAYYYLFINPKLGAHYRANREAYLKELFGK